MQEIKQLRIDSKKFNMPRCILQYFVIITLNFHMILWGDGRGGQRGGRARVEVVNQ